MRAHSCTGTALLAAVCLLHPEAILVAALLRSLLWAHLGVEYAVASLTSAATTVAVRREGGSGWAGCICPVFPELSSEVKLRRRADGCEG